MDNLDITMKDMIDMQVIKCHQELHKPHTKFLHAVKGGRHKGAKFSEQNVRVQNKLYRVQTS